MCGSACPRRWPATTTCSASSTAASPTCSPTPAWTPSAIRRRPAAFPRSCSATTRRPPRRCRASTPTARRPPPRSRSSPAPMRGPARSPRRSPPTSSTAAPPARAPRRAACSTNSSPLVASTIDRLSLSEDVLTDILDGAISTPAPPTPPTPTSPAPTPTPPAPTTAATGTPTPTPTSPGASTPRASASGRGGALGVSLLVTVLTTRGNGTVSLTLRCTGGSCRDRVVETAVARLGPRARRRAVSIGTTPSAWPPAHGAPSWSSWTPPARAAGPSRHAADHVTRTQLQTGVRARTIRGFALTLHARRLGDPSDAESCPGVAEIVGGPTETLPRSTTSTSPLTASEMSS